MASDSSARLHVEVVTAVFPPETVVSSQTSAAIAEELVRLGHRVTVLAPFPSRAGGQTEAARRRFGFTVTGSAAWGRVVRCPTWFSRDAGLLTRLAEYLSFGLTSTLAFLGMRRPDAVYVNSWPLFGAGPIVTAARVMRVPIVLSVQDVYPESLVAQGRLREESLSVRLLRALDGVIARSAFRVVVLNEEFRRTYERTRSVPRERVEVVANFTAPETIEPNCGDGALIRQKHGIPADVLLAVYAGNIGPASAAEDLVSAYESVSLSSSLRLLIAGQGSRLEECRRLACKLRHGHVAFESPWRVEETSAVLAAADILLLPTRGTQSAASMPSKLISYLLASRPVIVQAAPDTALAALVAAAGCGIVVPPGDPEAMATALGSMAELSVERRVGMGQAGRSYAMAHFTRAACLPALVGLLEDAAMGRPNADQNEGQGGRIER